MTNTIDELKQRARAGDLEALRELRERGFFGANHTAEGYPVSHTQRRLWIVDQMSGGSGTYHIPIALWLDGGLDARALREGLREVVQRHESLRTTFAEAEGRIHQFVRDQVDLPWEDIDLSADPEREERARRIAAEHAARCFDVARGPLLRAALLRFAPERHLFLFNIHHIVSDLLSLEVLVRELSACYEAFAAGRTPLLPTLPLQYKDFAAWQNRLLDGEEGTRHRAYWLRQLAGPLPSLDLPADFTRPPLKTYHGRVCRAVLDGALTERLWQLGLCHGMTLFMVLAAAVKVLLHRYTGQQDITVGFPMAGRDHPDLAGQIGCFVNTVALRDRLAAGDNFITVLGRVRQTLLDAYEHQAYPFDRLVEELELPRDMSRSPLFDVSVSLAHGGGEAPCFGAVKVSPYDDGFASAKVDLSFDFYESGDGLELAIAYCTDLFAEERVLRMAEHFARLAHHAAASPELPIGRLPLMSAEEEHRVLVEFNATERPLPADETIVDRFEHQAACSPDAVAVSFRGRQLSYGELNARANQVAHRLRRHGVGAEVRVGLFMEPCMEVVSGFLGILKAGGVYLPLDPANPGSRLAAMLEDAKPALILAQTALAERLPVVPECRVIAGDEAEAAGSAGEDANPPRRAGPDQAAYVIFTSGSTGRAKAAVLLHRGLGNVAGEQARLFGPGPGDRVLQFAALGFDASVFEMVMALAHGAAVCLSSRAELLPGAALLATLEREQISIATFPPSALAALPDAELPKLRVATVAGEACPAEVVSRWAKGRAFFNLYGPTEATIWVSAARCEPDGGAPNIGRPIANTRIYLLDPQRQPVPIGVAGELCIAGVGLARHYLYRPELTDEQFVPDPFDRTPGARLYRSGDLARHRPDGAIEFLGRIDHQVKLRGYRIEPGEIEAALAAHPEVREAVVLAREDPPGRSWLVAYVTPRGAREALDAADLRWSLRERVPDYMVPARFVVLDEMPLTLNKKIDRKALPAGDGRWPGSDLDFVAPRDDLERVLAGIFAEALRVERVGTEDNFFELGGDSLLATRIVSRLREAFRADLSIPDLFRAGHVGALAEVLRGALPAGRAEKVAAALLRLRGMSDEEKQALLERKRG